MADLQSLYDEHKHLPEDAQKQAGKAIAGTMKPDLEAFLNTVLDLIKKGSIDAKDPKTFLNAAVYDALPQASKDQADLALGTLGDLLLHVVEFRLSPQTPDSSPQLETMIAGLLQTKTRIEEKLGDVFKF
jgi:hypothetical protein